MSGGKCHVCGSWNDKICDCDGGYNNCTAPRYGVRLTAHRKCCSHRCHAVDMRTKERVSRRELVIELLSGASRRKIGEKFGATESTVRNWEKWYKIQAVRQKDNVRLRSDDTVKAYMITCLVCGEDLSSGCCDCSV